MNCLAVQYKIRYNGKKEQKESNMKENSRKGFTLVELVIVVSILGVLVGLLAPVFSGYVERSRETTDLSNVRTAYSEIMFAVIDQDISSPLYTANDTYLSVVPLKQARDGWSLDPDKLVIAGISSSDTVHWLNTPRAKGQCKVYYMNGDIFINWSIEDHINSISAADFLTKNILESILGGGSQYPYTVINSNEHYDQNGGTQKFIDYAQAHGFDLNDYGARTWQIYAKESNSSADILSKPAIYWTGIELTPAMLGKKVPVMGFRDGKYDVYYAEVVKYNSGTADEYFSLKNNFANVTDAGGSATFQFNEYSTAKKVYDKLLAAFETYGDVTPKDIVDNGLN